MGGGTATAEGVKVGAQAGGFLKNALIVVSVAFLMYDVVDLGFTIRDLIQNKGSEASECLRDKANQLEQIMTKQCHS